MMKQEKSVRSDQSGSFPQDRFSWVWLAIATALSFFNGGRWVIPLAVWFAPVFLLRFVRTQHPLRGYLLAALIRAAAGSITLQGIIPAPGFIFYPLVLILSFIMTLPYLIDRLIAPRLQGFVATLVFPAAYTAVEFLGSHGPFGAFTSIANTQYGDLPLMQVAAVTGIWGITFLITWFAAVVNWAWERRFAWYAVRRGVLIYAVILIAVLAGGGARLVFFPDRWDEIRVVGLSAPQAALAEQDQKLPMETSMVLNSGKASQADLVKARSAYAAVQDDLLARSQYEARAGAKIVVWPETGASVLQDDAPALIQRASALAKQEGIYLDLGLAVIQRNPGNGPAILDEAVLLDPAGNVVWTYEKTHLVPFGETGEVVPGNGKLPWVDSPYGRLGNVICFDLDFPGTMRQAGQAGVDLMLAPSNDWQAVDPIHTQAAAFRAIENGFVLVRQASHGLAMTVDYEGHVLAASDFFNTDQQVMVAYVPMYGVRTIYAAIGDLFAWLCVAGVVVFAGLAIRLGRRQPAAAAATESQPAGAYMQTPR
jgi:apolipoprotein N-acyltransferase